MADDDLIILDDELHLLPGLNQEQQLLQHRNNVNPGPSSTNKRRHNGPLQQQKQTVPGRGIKRARNGATILSANEMLPQPVPSASAESKHSKSIIVDGQDIYYIEEVDDSGPAAAMAPSVPFLDPAAIMAYPDNGSDTNDAPESQLADLEEDDYYSVQPLELSDIWNDLITANQEILILLELSDLKEHIVDARRIEEQIKDMACEYCYMVFPDIKALDKHIRKIHFQTELFECDSCDAKFRFFARFKDHLNGHTSKRVYKCDECNHQYAYRMGFLVHKILDHMKLNGVYVCPKCKVDCRDAQHYKLHIASHIEFGPGQSSQIRAQSMAAQSGTATPPSAAPSNNGTARKTYAKENERNKFLNVYESFSKNRNMEQSLGTVSARKRHI